MKGIGNPTSASNRLGLDYRAEAARLGAAPKPIIDVHTHINGTRAAEIYRDVCDVFGVCRTYSQTRLDGAEKVRSILGDRIRFIAVPDFMSDDKAYAFREGFLENVQAFHERFGSRIVKFWAAPRFRDYIEELGSDDVIAMDSPWRVRVAELAQSLGMMFMTHVGHPDTWFSTKYADASVYGTKSQQYVAFERMLDRFSSPWIAAHMGGWPENLGFLSGLLSRHDNLYLDTSATKWMVREFLELRESVPADGFFRLTHTFNTGSAFGLFKGQNTPLIAASFIGILVLAWVYRSYPHPSPLLRLSLGLQLAGATGNLTDRIIVGRVIDWADVGRWPIFNVADSAIVVGVVILAWFIIAKKPVEHESAPGQPEPASLGPPQSSPSATLPDEQLNP